MRSFPIRSTAHALEFQVLDPQTAEMGASTSSSANQQTEPYGLFEFETDPLLKSALDEVPYNVDIVAIHGITGDAYAT
jgi:hypothetical protein